MKDSRKAEDNSKEFVSWFLSQRTLIDIKGTKILFCPTLLTAFKR